MALVFVAAAIILVGFGAAAIVPRWLVWLSVILFVEQAIETVTVFGESGFFAPGGTMNLYVGGVIGMAWVIGVLYWGYQQWKAQAPGQASSVVS